LDSGVLEEEIKKRKKLIVLGARFPTQRALDQIPVPVAAARKYKAALAEWGLTSNEIAATETALLALRAAEASQETALINLPPATAELYAEKGRAYLLMKQLARTGRRRLFANPAAAGGIQSHHLEPQGREKGRRSPGASETVT
jgi:hypothetical protein